MRAQGLLNRMSSQSKEENKLCDECNECSAEFFCEECDQSLCQTCNQELHSKGARKLHHCSPLHSSSDTHPKSNYKEPAEYPQALYEQHSTFSSYGKTSSPSVKSRFIPRIII